MIIYKCDRCKRTFEGERGKPVGLPIGWYLLAYGRFSLGRVEYHICPECRVVLKIPNEKPIKAVGEQLIELIEALTQGAVEDAMENV